MLYPSEPTQTEILDRFIRDNNKPETLEEMLVRKIDEHKSKIPTIKIGQDYYDNNPDIINESPPVDATGLVDPLKSDSRLVNNFQKNLVDQKVSYLVGKPISFKHDDVNLVDKIHEVLGDRFDDKLHSILTSASNKGVEWLHPYLNENGDFKLFRVPAEQSIPIWTDKEKDELESFIRFYELDNEMRVEYWTTEDVSYFIYSEGQLYADYYHDGQNSQFTHFSTGSWGKVPFIAFKNNDSETSDVFMYKSLVDAYNRRLSDTDNVFSESNELIYVLKNYDSTDLSDFKRNLRYYGAIKIDDDGGVDTIQKDIPVESSKEYLNLLYKNIMLFGQAVDFSEDKFGSAPSGVALEFLYTNLNLKADKLARKTKVAIQELLWFVFEHFKLSEEHKNVEISFNYNKVANNELQVQMAANSLAVVSRETAIENHPFVEDLSAEMERIQAEQLEYGSLEDGGVNETR
ncbi:phage portal protein [Mammaliicoccus sp. D-M17]|uniref:phage portal protein n=1 Tax=Mammaliicoccus sp. D-M17 TaxID=2898677 RepID=UPI001EFC2842|nr:phage portal protein [Mammaliicoccus sp. D-M17]